MDEEIVDVYKIVVIGNSGVGKSSIIERYVRNKFNYYNEATIGVEFDIKAKLVLKEINQFKQIV